MTDAPKRVWLQSDPENVGDGFPHEDFWEYVTWCASPVNNSDLEYHLARPGQPCSTDEFLERLQTSDLDPCQWHEAIFDWSIGEFRAALDAIEGINS